MKQPKIKKVVITKENASTFHFLEYKRAIRKSAVKKIRKYLVDRGDLDTPLVLNKNKGGYEIIDGNHRLTACLEALEEGEREKCSFYAFIYEDLSEETMKKVFSVWNMGTAQTLADLLQTHQDDIPLFGELNKHPDMKFSIATVNTRNIAFVRFMQIYVPWKFNMQKPSEKFRFLEYCKKSPKSDASMIHSMFCQLFDLFGYYDGKSIYWKNPLLTCILRLWLYNYGRFSEKELLGRMKKISGSERAIYWSSFGTGREAKENCMRDLLEIVNKGYRKEKSLFVNKRL